MEDGAIVVNNGEVEEPHGDDHTLHDEHQKCCEDDPSGITLRQGGQIVRGDDIIQVRSGGTGRHECCKGKYLHM